jgi:hypothetical protein
MRPRNNLKKYPRFHPLHSRKSVFYFFRTLYPAAGKGIEHRAGVVFSLQSVACSSQETQGIE